MDWFKKAALTGHPDAEAQIEYMEYEIAQKAEDDILTLFESNSHLQVLRPIQNALRTSSTSNNSFHKSASMPSLQQQQQQQRNKGVVDYSIQRFFNRNPADMSELSRSSLYL